MSRTLNSKQYFAQLNTIYFAQAGVMLIFTLVIFALAYSGNIVSNPDDSLTKTLTYALVVVVVAGFSGAHFLYNFLLSKIDKSMELKKKMAKYVGIVLIRSACLELPGMFAAIVFFLNGNYYLLLIPIFIALVFYMLRPTHSSIAEDLNLTPDERTLINNADAIIAEG